MVAGLKTTRHEDARSIQQPKIYRPVYIPASNHRWRKRRRPSCRELTETTAESPELRDMSTLWKSSLSLRGRNLRIQTSCHNIQIKHCLRQLLRDPELRFSHTADRSVRDASATVAQLKPVKQDKSWLCQACTLQSTAEMTMAEDSAHTAGIYLKDTTDHILSALFR